MHTRARLVGWLALCLLPIGCGPAPEDGRVAAAQDAAEEAAALAEGPDAQRRAASAPKPAPAGGGWLEADGPGETALEWRSDPDAAGFMLSCAQEESMFRISLPDPASTPTASGAPATLFVEEEPFALTVIAGDVNGPHLDADLPVTPRLLRSLGQARRVRLAVGESALETAEDAQGKLAGLAASCSNLTGIEPETP